MLIQSDARRIPIKSNSVQCVITSPPYWGLRDYGLGNLGIGLESNPEAYVAAIVTVFREVWRVLRPDGTVWLNLGDSYTSTAQGTVNAPERIAGGIERTSGNNLARARYRPFTGLKQKDLVGIPWRVAFALQTDGWWLRSDIIWSKPNPMPESVTDRPTKAHEYLFLLTKSASYFYDAEAVKEPSQPSSIERMRSGWNGNEERDYSNGKQNHLSRYIGSNLRSVWAIATEAYSEAHYATFPRALVERCIKAGTSEKGSCAKCGSPWERVLESHRNGRDWNKNNRAGGNRLESGQSSSDAMPDEYRPKTMLGWKPTCKCGASEIRPCVVYDPFVGSGTVVMVARDLGRTGIGSDLKYHELSTKRIYGPLYAKTINA